MRSSTALTAVLISYSALSTAVQLADLLAFTSSSVGPTKATPGCVPYAEAPIPTRTSNTPVLQNLELRDVPPVAPVPETPKRAAPNANPAAPNGNAVADPGAVPNQAAPNANPAAPAAPGNPALNPAAPAVAPVNTATPPANPAASLTLSVQWVETWIGGTSQTWVPQTLTFGGQGYTTQAPSPGKGQIGIGTLKGETGVTRLVVVGSAPAVCAGWIGALVGVGVGALSFWR